MHAIGPKIIASYHSESVHIDFKKSAGRVFATTILDGSAVQYPLDISISIVEVVPIKLQSSTGKIVKWLLKNHHFPVIQENKIFFQHKNNDVKDSLKEFLLHMAVRNGDVETIRLLLQQGADPNVLNDEGVSPLDLAICHTQEDLF